MKNKAYIMMVFILSIIFTVSSGFLIKYYYNSAQQSKYYNDLIDVIQTQQHDELKELMSDTESNFTNYKELYLKNNDMVGWIKIDGTQINYPVMQSKSNPNFYLKHNFDKEYTNYGCPYIQENCNVELPSDNLIVYAHNMKNGTMFSDLEKYKNKLFWEKHRIITFDTLTNHNKYEIIAAFKTEVYTDSPNSFKYYQFVNAQTPDEFIAFIEKCKELSFYDTGISAKYGDKLLTLSTCEYSSKNSRMVVVAKLIK